ncbi:MAG TPA: ABC transporter substrate-binding protein [Naasia sp.]
MNTTRIGAAGLAGFALLALTACGGGGQSGSGGGGSDSGLGLLTEGTLTVCANLETPPNIYAEEDGTPIGVEIDIAKDMADEMGLEIEFKEYDFAGLIPALQAQQCDTIISSLYIKPEREEIADFVPYLESASGVAVSQENPANVTGFDDSLCGVSAIGITGATGAALLEEKSAECQESGLEPIELTLLDSATDALQQVVAGQADAFMDTAELVGYYEKQSDGEFMAIGEPVGEIEIGAASLKGNDALHDALQDAFDTMVEDGRYDAILEEWGYEAVSIVN